MINVVPVHTFVSANSIEKSKKEAQIHAKAKLAKAERKARGRGVSGSMCKKDKGIGCGRCISVP